MTTRHEKRPKRSREATPHAAGQTRRWAITVLLAVFLVAYGTLEIVGYTQKSATWDEPIHLTTGYLALARGDYRLDPSHPPFLRMWAALPLLAMDPVRVDTGVIDRLAPIDWVSGSHAYDFSREFMYRENDADRLLYAGRFMVILLGGLLGVLLFLWAYEWLGFAPAVFALALYTIEPNLAGHASLVTTDFGVTCFMFAAIYFLWRTCRSASGWSVAALSIAVALAVVTKFSGMILAPIIIVLLTVAVWRGSAVNARVAARILGVLLVSSFAAVWMVYGLSYAPTRLGTGRLELHSTSIAQATLPLLAPVAGWIDAHQLLPNAFVQGFLMFAQSMAQANWAFLAGRYSADGWWYYFPIAFLIKTPIAFLVLFVAGVVVCARRWRSSGSTNELFVVLPIVTCMAVAMASHLNIGVRHILPIYPFVILVAAAAVAAAVESKNVTGKLAVAVVMAYGVVRFGMLYPHTLTFFNRFVGGPSNGFKYLVDSNLDWGQHLKPLKRWMDRNGVGHINLAYFGQADPVYYNIDCTWLPGSSSFARRALSKPRLPGYVAISATVLSGVYLQPHWRLFYRPFRDRAAVAEIGHSIRVYWVDEWPEPDGAAWNDPVLNPAGAETERALADALRGLSWWERASLHYRRYLANRPSDFEATENFGIALIGTGAIDEAVTLFRRGVELNPRDARAQYNLANALLDTGDVSGAAIHAQEAAVLLPTNAAVHDLFGRTLALQGKLDAAIAEFEGALRLDPGHTGAQGHLARMQQIARR